MKYYEVSTRFPNPERLIKQIEVEKETDSSVWINGRRRAKVNQYENYVATWEEALSLVNELVHKKMRNAQIYMDQALIFQKAFDELKTAVTADK